MALRNLPSCRLAIAALMAICVSGPACEAVAQTQQPDQPRSFGQAPDAALKAYREAVPQDPQPGTPGYGKSNAERTLDFMKSTPASTFVHGGPPMPTDTIPNPPDHEEDLRK